MNAASIGTDSALIFRLTTASEPGLSMVPARRAGFSPIRHLRSTVSRRFSSVEPAAHVLERIGEVAIDGRHVAAATVALRPPGRLRSPHQVKRGVDIPARLEDIPELGELGRRLVAEPLVELQVDQVEA